MKFKTNYLLLAIFLLIIVTLAMMNSCKMHRSTHIRGYEGLQNIEYNASALVTKNTNLNQLPNITNNKNLHSANFGKESTVDVFSGTPGKIECENKASGLSNSQGGLCLNDSQMKLLRSRGGNAEGGDFQYA
jgi:hypothetical protein